MLTSPYKTQARHSRNFSSTTGANNRDPSPGKPLPRDTQFTTTIDTLLLPGVIGTTVEGPKTPLRSARAPESSSVLQQQDRFSIHRTQTTMTPPPAYNDDDGSRYDSEDQFFSPVTRGQGRSKSETPKKNRIQHNGLDFRTPQPRRVLDAAEWRKKYRPHDTPNPRPKHSDGPPNASPSASNISRSHGRRTRQQRTAAALYDGFSPLQEEHEEFRGEEDEEFLDQQHRQGLNLDGHDGKGTMPDYGHMHNVHTTGDNGIHMADDSGLDVESDRDGQDPAYDSMTYRDLSDAHAYSDEESLAHQIRREEYKEVKRRRREERARLKKMKEEDREKNQLGFLRRLVNMFSPDDFSGYGSAPGRDEDNLSSLSESEDVDQPPLYNLKSSTSASRRRVSINNAATPSSSPRRNQKIHHSAQALPTLQPLSRQNSTYSLNAHESLARDDAKSEYYDASASDDDQYMHYSMNGETDPEAQAELLEGRGQMQDRLRQEEEDKQGKRQYSQQRQRRHYVQTQDSQRTDASPRVYPWHVIARMSQHQYRLLLAALYNLALVVLDIMCALRDGITTLVKAAWATAITFYSGLSAWLREGVDSGLFSPRTIMSVGLLLLAIIASNMLANNSFLEHSWDSFSRIYRDPYSSAAVDISARMSAAMSKVGIDLLSKISTPTPSTRWESNDSQSTPTNLGIMDLKFQKQQNKRLEAIEARLSLIHNTLAQLDGADHELEQRLKAQLKDLAVQIAAVDTKVDHVIQDVSTLKHRLQSGLWLNQTVMEMIHDELPRYLVVAKDPATGQLKIPAEFWQMAREMFVTADEATQLVKDQIAKGLAGVMNGGGETAEGGPQDPAIDSPAVSQWQWITEFARKRERSQQWNSFLKDHEKALNELVDRRQAVISRQSFLGLVRTEAASIWQAIEPQVLPWLERRGRLSSSSASTSSSNGPKVGGNIYTGDVLTEAEKEAMSLLIDEALERYTADAIAKPDYALYSAGGRIIPKLTTRCEDLRWLPNVITFFTRPLSQRPPEYAIRPGTAAGECWPIEGRQGQLGIRLARHIIPTEVTIEHADMRVVLDMGSAPKDFEVWGIPATEDVSSGKNKKSNDRAKEYPSGSKPPLETTEKQGDGEATMPKEGLEAPWPGAFLLTRAAYQADVSTSGVEPDGSSSLKLDSQHQSHPKPRQTFPIPLSKQHVPVMGVVLKIKSNWGHPSFTCLYRVRVHGYQP